MDRDTITHENLVDRYVRGELTPRQEVEFEEHMMTDAWVQRQVMEVLGIRMALRKRADSEDRPESADDGGSGGPRRWRLIRPVPALAAALVVVSLVAVVSLSRSPSAVLPAVGGVTDVLLVETRASAPADQEITAAPGAPLQIEIETGYTGQSALRAVIEDARGQAVLRTEPLYMDDYGRLRLMAYAPPAGRYELALLEVDSGALVSRFGLELRSPDAI